MARGPKRHLKRLNAPKHWMLDKLGGIWAPRPSTGPHKLRECMPLIILLRNKLKYALTGKECKYILMQRLIKVDGKTRTDLKYPAGFMDVIGIEKSDEFFRLVYDIRGRFNIHRISKVCAAPAATEGGPGGSSGGLLRGCACGAGRYAAAAPARAGGANGLSLGSKERALV